VFAFDLDGTITACELLPRIARLAKLEKPLEELTRQTLRGDIPFASSFRRRFAMLRHIPLSRVQALVAATPLDPHIEAFIQSRRSECVVVTGNLDLWTLPLLRRLGCRWFSSRGAVLAGELTLLSVLDKGEAAKTLLAEGKRIVAVGESVNDAPLFRASALAIAFGGVHEPAPLIRRLAHRYAGDGESLCAMLRGAPLSRDGR
jgi:HAD superfamily phosphoserine phosphatase-like hydrolase